MELRECSTHWTRMCVLSKLIIAALQRSNQDNHAAKRAEPVALFDCLFRVLSLLHQNSAQGSKTPKYLICMVMRTLIVQGLLRNFYQMISTQLVCSHVKNLVRNCDILFYTTHMKSKIATCICAHEWCMRVKHNPDLYFCMLEFSIKACTVVKHTDWCW